MKKRSKLSKLFFVLLNLLLLSALAWGIVHLVYAPSGMSVELTSNMEEVQSGDRVELRFVIRDTQGEVERNFERVHEKLLHLIVVRGDLTEFQHVHPDFDKETGEFSVSLSFSEPGPYHLFADFTPENSTQTVLSFPVEVGSEEVYEPVILVPSTLEPFTVDGLTLTPDFPLSIKTGEAVSYSFTVTLDGKAVTLEDYLGAKGHSVVLSEGNLNYIHTHPEGDALKFETVFDQPGLYKAFTQFQVEGRIFTVEYVFTVAKGTAEDETEGMEMGSEETQGSH